MECVDLSGLWVIEEDVTFDFYIAGEYLDSLEGSLTDFAWIDQTDCRIRMEYLDMETGDRSPLYDGTVSDNALVVKNIEGLIYNDPELTLTITRNDTILKGEIKSHGNRITLVGMGVIEGTLEGMIKGVKIPKTPFTAAVEVITFLTKDVLRLTWEPESFDVFETEAIYTIKLATNRIINFPERTIEYTIEAFGSADEEDYKISSAHYPNPDQVLGETYSHNGISNIYQYDISITSDMIEEGVEELRLTVESDDISIQLPSEDFVLRIIDTEDFDNDGLTDAWEFEHFGNFERNGDGDLDGDSFSDRIEFEVHTNPNRSSSYPTRLIVRESEGARVNSSIRSYYGTDQETGEVEKMYAEVFLDAGLEVYGWQKGEDSLGNLSPFSTFGRLEFRSGKTIEAIPRIFANRQTVLDSNIPYWFSDGRVLYTVDESEFIEGGSSLKIESTSTRLGVEGSLQCYLQGPGKVNFWWKTEGGFWGCYYKHRPIRATQSNEWQEVEIDLPEGVHQILLISDRSGPSGGWDYSAWVDNFTTTAIPRKIIDPSFMFPHFGSESRDYYSNFDPRDDHDGDGMPSFRELMHGRNPSEFEIDSADYYSAEIDFKNRVVRIKTRLNLSNGHYKYYLVLTEDFQNFHRVPIYVFNRSFYFHPNVSLNISDRSPLGHAWVDITYRVPLEAPFKFVFLEMEAPDP